MAYPAFISQLVSCSTKSLLAPSIFPSSDSCGFCHHQYPASIPTRITQKRHRLLKPFRRTRPTSCSANDRTQPTDTRPTGTFSSVSTSVSRRTLLRVLLSSVVMTSALGADRTEARVVVADPNAGETITTTPTGLQYYDFVSSSDDSISKSVQSGDQVTIQYTMGTTGARNGWRIDTATISFTVGGKEVIDGLNEGVQGMKPGGRRRLLVPASLGYHSQNDQPIPKGFAEFQRFKNIYLNVNRPFLPDVVFDVTLLKIR